MGCVFSRSPAATHSGERPQTDNDSRSQNDRLFAVIRDIRGARATYGTRVQQELAMCSVRPDGNVVVSERAEVNELSVFSEKGTSPLSLAVFCFFNRRRAIACDAERAEHVQNSNDSDRLSSRSFDMNYLRAMPNERDLHNIETRKNAVYDAAFRGEIGDIPAALDALDAYGPGGGITSMAALPPLSVIEFGLHTKLNNISCIHEAVENVNTKFEALRAELNAASTLQCLIERSQAFNAALSDARDSMCNATHKILDVRHDDILTLYPRVLADTGLSEGNRLHKQLAAEITSCKKLRLTTLYMFALFREIRRDGRFVLDCALAGQPAGLRQALDGTISPALDLMNNIVKDADSDKKISDTAEIFKILKTLDKAQEERLKKLTWQLSRHRR